MTSAHCAFREALGANIRRARERAGLELVDFAGRLGVDRTTVIRMESGGIGISADRLDEIVRITGTSVQRLMPRPNPTRRSA